VTPIVFNGRYHIHFYPQLGRLLRRLKPDIVHVDEEPYNLATWLAMQAARRGGARRLFYTWQNIYRTLPFPFSAVERANYALTNGAIAANGDAVEVLRRKGYTGHTWVIPPGLDPDLYRPGPPKRPTEYHVGYVGRLVSEKGVDLLIRACASLTDSWQLSLVGDGPERPSLEKLAEELGVTKQVRFQRSIPSIDVPNVLREFCVLVLPSRSLPNWREQFGRVLVEAMACEVAVIGSTCGEIPRVVGDAGLIFPEGDWRALADQLFQLQQDVALRTSFGVAGRDRVLRNFTHGDVADHTRAVYRSLLSS